MEIPNMILLNGIICLLISKNIAENKTYIVINIFSKDSLAVFVIILLLLIRICVLLKSLEQLRPKGKKEFHPTDTPSAFIMQTSKYNFVYGIAT